MTESGTKASRDTEEGHIPRPDKKSAKKKMSNKRSYFRCFFDADFLIIKGFSFFLYGAYGGLIPYLSLYFKQLSLGALYAGLIVGIRPLVQCIGAPFWSVMADRFRAGKIIFIGSIIAWIAKALIILTVRPQNQYCIQMYTNATSNKTYVYTYNLWDPEAEDRKTLWVVLPLEKPEIVQENKVAVVDSQKKKPTPETLPKKVLGKKKPADHHKTNKNQEDKPFQKRIVDKEINRESNHGKDIIKLAFDDTANTNGSTSDENLPLQESKTREPQEVEIEQHQEEMGERLGVHISKIVEVYSEELHATVTFLTNVDQNEVQYMFVIFMLIIIIGEFLESPTYALSDASILKRLGDEKEYYGRMRLWGSVGWASAAAMVGAIVSASRVELCEVPQNSYVVAFYLFIGFVCGAFVNALWFRFSYDEKKHFEDIGKVGPLLLSLRHSSFLLATLYLGFSYGNLVHFVNWIIDDLEGSSAIMGAAGAAREIAAATMFAFSATAIQAMGNLNTMVFCLMSYIVCFICYSILNDPWMAVALEVLDGGTYGLLWSNCVSYMSTVGARLGIIETTQGILQGVFWGLGNGCGTMVTGSLIEMFGSVDTFRAFAVAGAVVLLILIIAQYIASLLEERRRLQPEYELVSESDDSKYEEPDKEKLPIESNSE